MWKVSGHEVLQPSRISRILGQVGVQCHQLVVLLLLLLVEVLPGVRQLLRDEADGHFLKHLLRRHRNAAFYSHVVVLGAVYVAVPHVVHEVVGADPGLDRRHAEALPLQRLPEVFPARCTQPGVSNANLKHFDP